MVTTGKCSTWIPTSWSSEPYLGCAAYESLKERPEVCPIAKRRKDWIIPDAHRKEAPGNRRQPRHCAVGITALKTRTGGWQSQFTRTKTSILQFVEFTARSAELTVAEQRFCIRQVESCISRCSRDQFGIDRRSFPELAGGDMRCCSGVADVRSEYR